MEPTTRQLQVLTLVAEGMGMREVGEELGIAPDTVRTHMQNLLYRMGVRTRAHAVAIGFRRAWLE